MTFSLYTENTEYGTYTREAVSRTSSETSSSKPKLSLPSPFKKSHNERKRPADVMAATPSPQHSPSTPRTFYSASYFHRPSMIRRNAYTGKPSAASERKEPDDTLMASTDDFVLPEPALAVHQPRVSFAEIRPADPGPARGIIDVSAPQEERPGKRARLTSVSHEFSELRKFCVSYLRSNVFPRRNRQIDPLTSRLECISKWRLA